ncbi:MAG: NAD-dependent epimerase/dehydratase family protein [Myxococcota bacterium]
MSDWVIIGCGFIGTRLARSLLADGESVLACARDKNRLAELEREGADAYIFDAKRSHAFNHAIGTKRAPKVVYALPPIPGFPGGEIVGRAASKSLAVGANRFVFLSSTAVYGEGQDGQVVDEETDLAMSDLDARAFISAEGAVENARANGLDAAILRLSPVYGPGRGVRNRLLEGTYKLLDQGEHVYSRIHVDDVVGIIRSVVEDGPVNATYCLADDRPCPQREYAEWLSEHLGTKKPTSVPSLAPGMPRRRIRNRHVSNAKLKSELKYVFRHPTYREGELAIDRETGVETKPESLPPLIIHKKANLAKIAETTGLSRLAVVHKELAAKAEERISSNSEAVIYVLSGQLQLLHGEEKHTAGAGSLIEVPTLGVQVATGDKGAATFLVIGLKL